MSKKYLILVLEGPMQSWGLQGKFDYRDTAPHPTKSGVVGIICAALGIERNDREGISRIAAMDMTTITIKPGVVMTDYQTVGHNYRDKQMQLHTAEGKVKKDKSGQVSGAVTHRDYLCDASFAVVFTGEAELIDEIAVTLNNPKWGGYLGRKCCLPSRSILECVVDSEEEVKKVLRELGVDENSSVSSDCSGNTMGIIQQDLPIDYHSHKYHARSVVAESDFIW